MIRSIALLLLLVFGVDASPISAATAPDPPMTAKDLLATVTFREVSFAPNGGWLVWTVRRSDRESNLQVGDLWRLDLRQDGAEARRLTGGSHHDRAPAWSPDSRWIGFLSKRGDEKAKTQIWRMAPDGGEAEVVSTWEPGIESFRWAGDGRILFTAEEGKTQRERELEEKKDDAQVVEDPDHWKAVRLFALDPETKQATRLTTNDDRIEGFWLRSDGRAAVTRHIVSIQHTAQVGGPLPRYWLHDFDAGSSREILTDPLFDPGRVEFDPDGKHLWAQWVYSRISSAELRSNAGINTLWRIDLATGERTRVVINETMGLADHYRTDTWRPFADGLIAVAAAGVHGHPVRVERKGEAWRVRNLEGEGLRNWIGMAVSADGRRIAGFHTEADAPERLMLGEVRGDRVRNLRAVHDPNEALRAKVSRAEAIEWTSSYDGATVNGILTWPRGFEEGRRYPLMVWIHGGPSGVDADAFENYWSSFPQVLAGKGLFVLQPNYRGSSNHGLDVVEAITQGRYYELEIPDILSGVDHLIERGWVHPDSLGTTGWSNGAILSIQLTLETDRFKVCCAGAGDVNWTSDFGNCAFGPNFDVTYFGSTPWDDPELYVSKSPLFRMDEVTTPTLIQFGEKDTSVPTEQGWQHYRALQMLDRAAVRFLVYPGMGHGLTKLSYQERKVAEELAWIDHYLFGRAPAPDEVRKKGSPLDGLLALREVRRSGAATDVPRPTLDPRALDKHAIQVARTEATRAQLAPFLQSEAGSAHREGVVEWDAAVGAFPPGTGDLPASGLSLADARAYARWLQARTGEVWRLPTAEEWEAAATLVSSGPENNLCHWANFSPTWDEALELRERITEGPGAVSLLRPVASITSDGRARLFDLHGSVAEWCEDGKARGRTVLDPCDPAAPVTQSHDARLIGVRLVREIE